MVIKYHVLCIFVKQALKELKIIFKTEIKQKKNHMLVLKYREVLNKSFNEC